MPSSCTIAMARSGNAGHGGRFLAHTEQSLAVVPNVSAGVLVAFLACGLAHAAGSGDGAYRIFTPGGTDVKWGQPSLSGGATITYGFVRPGQRTKHVRNCPDIRPVDALLRQAGIERSDFETEFERALAIWQAVANVRFRRKSPGAVAQILVGVQGRPVGRAFTDMRYVWPIGKNAPGQITSALICLNPFAGWKIGYDGDLSAYDLRYTFLHEIGHAIGLDHPGASGNVMSFRYEERFRTLQPGDINGARYLYGMPVPLEAGTPGRLAAFNPRKGGPPAPGAAGSGIDVTPR